MDVTQEYTSTTVAPMTSTTSPDDVLHDEDYSMETSTHLEWEDSTGFRDISLAVEKNSAELETIQSNSDWLSRHTHPRAFLIVLFISSIYCMYL